MFRVRMIFIIIGILLGITSIILFFGGAFANQDSGGQLGNHRIMIGFAAGMLSIFLIAISSDGEHWRDDD